MFAIEDKSEILSLKIKDNLIESLRNLPDDANETIVDNNFIATSFFNALGFILQERVPAYKTGKGKDKVDYALRKNTENSIFLHDQIEPEILVELKRKRY